tara:strand:- start:92 stop:457 length:366 start_codon:yes stop_codon:yes gene_type:complete
MRLSYNSIFFKIYCHLFTKKVGTDDYGNLYFKKKSLSRKNNFRERRFIVYKGIVEASKVPQQWNAWLHHVLDDPPTKKEKKPTWLKDHTPNFTGTNYAYEYKQEKESGKIKRSYTRWSPDE